MGAIFPMLAPDHKGAAVSVQNLGGGGLANFAGPALATVLVSGYGTQGVVVAFAALYFLGAVLTGFIRLVQPRGVHAMDVASSAKAQAVRDGLDANRVAPSPTLAE